MDGDTSVARGRVVGLLEAVTVSQATVLLGGIEPEAGETDKRLRFVLPDSSTAGPDR